MMTFGEMLGWFMLALVLAAAVLGALWFLSTTVFGWLKLPDKDPEEPREEVPKDPPFCKDCRYAGESADHPGEVLCMHRSIITRNLVTGIWMGYSAEKVRDGVRVKGHPGFRCGPSGKMFEPRPVKVPEDPDKVPETPKAPSPDEDPDD